MKKTFCGIDEAGRGPVIGPMVLASAVFDVDGLRELKNLNVRDSKKILPGRRRTLEPLVKELALEYKVVKVSAGDIDRLRKRQTLNEIEALKVAELICSLKSVPSKITVDAADSVAENYRTKIIEYVLKSRKDFKLPELVSEHKADDNYIEVGGASILAKVERDRQIEILKKKYGDFGSGYPADEVTQRYIKKILESGDIPSFVRRSWNTIHKGRQKKLGDY